MAAAPWRARPSRALSSPSPTNTAAGSPSSRALASISALTFLRLPSSCSTRTRIVAMPCLLELGRRLDELVRGQELDQLGRGGAVARVLDHLARLARRARGGVHHRGGGAGAADLAGVDAEVGDGQVGHRAGLG